MPLIRLALDGLAQYHRAQNGLTDNQASAQPDKREVAGNIDRLFAAVPQRG